MGNRRSRRDLCRELVPPLGDTERAGDVALILSFVGVVLALVTGWLGGELVDRLGVGVDDGAHLDAPSSLSGRPARERSRTMTGPR